MPTWEGDPRPIEPDGPRRSYNDVRDEPVLVRQVNTQDALEAFLSIFWSLLVIAWALLMLLVKLIVWIVKGVIRATHMARRSSRHRG